MLTYIFASYLLTGYICAMWMMVEDLLENPPKGVRFVSLIIGTITYIVFKTLFWPYALHHRNR